MHHPPRLLLLLLLLLRPLPPGAASSAPGLWHAHHAAAVGAAVRGAGVGEEEEEEGVAPGAAARHGPASIQTPAHGSFHGEYRHGRVHAGRGVDAVSPSEVYHGHFEAGVRHGAGVLRVGGTAYHGRWVHGRLVGTVFTSLRNGTRWSAKFKADRPWRGRTRWAWSLPDADPGSAGVFVGSWRDGQPGGYGVWMDGVSRYEGFFRQGAFHGHGVWHGVHRDGIGLVRYDGNFAAGKRSGYGVLHDADHVQYDGQFLDGLRHGIGFTRRPGMFWGRVVEKNVWRRGIKYGHGSLPHDEV